MDLGKFLFVFTRLLRGIDRLARGRTASIACAALLAMAAAVPVATAQGVGVSRNGQVRFATGHILVAPRDSVSDADFEADMARGGGRALGRLRGLNVRAVAVAAGNEEAMAERLARNPHVRFAEVDRLLEPGSLTNDPSFGSEWHLPRINAPQAWDVSRGTGVVIAILDSGVDGTHPDLVGQMVPGWNFYDNNSNTADVNGHGTAVAGAAAATSNNGVGVASVAGGARIMPIRITDPNAYAYWSTAAQGLTWAADHGARVANISYVGVSASATMQSAANYFRSKGGVVMVCAGNTGAVDNSASTDTMMVVAATDQNDLRASFSTYGSFVDIAAPGVSILTTARGGGYQYWDGTSLASPIVAGTAALILSRRPDFSPAQVDATLIASAHDLGTAGEDNYFGAGRVDAEMAVEMTATTPIVAADKTPPTVSIASPTGGTVSGTVTVAVSAKDNVGVARVDLRVNGSTVATTTTAPFSIAWNSTSVPNGNDTLTAVAYDAAGNTAASAGVPVNVANAAPAKTADTIAPTLAITNPVDGSRVSGMVSIATSANDNSGSAGITQVLSIDGVVRGSVIGTSLRYKWNAKNAATGLHAISVTARDAAGNTVIRKVTVTR